MRNKYRVYLYSCLFLLLIIAIIFKNNADKYYGISGDYFYKNNNITKAQQYYEKAFRLGNNDTKYRENYVNSIINSPLTINSQEKLVSIAEDNINDNASNTARYFLYNLKREIHNKYPLNYIKQASYNDKILHWGKLPITYDFKNTSGIPEEQIKGINEAFDEWERASSCRIKFKKVNINADINIDFISKEIDTPEIGKKYIIAYTTPNIVQNKLKSMVIKFNTKDIEGNFYSKNQIYNTALHEIFHALGFMGHSYEKNNIMHMSKDDSVLQNDAKINLTEADKTTLELLYKIKPDITNANDLTYEYIPYLILGDESEINYSKQNEAKNYIRKAPTLPQGYIDLAESYVLQKKYDDAVKILNKALKLAKNEDTKYIIFYNLAVAYFYDEMYEVSIDNANLAEQIKNEQDTHFLKAENYTKLNKTQNAIEEYVYLTHYYPDNIDYAINLTNIYIKKRDYINARKTLKNYIKNNPADKNNPRLSNYGILKI